MNRKAGWAATILLVAAGIAYQVLIYQAAHGGVPAWLRLTLKGLPFLLLAFWAWSRASRRLAWFTFIFASAVLVFWADSRPYGDAAYGVPHAIVYLSLAWLFGHTLFKGREPLVTSMADLVHGPLAPEMRAHTRRVTWAWTLFSLGQLLLSALLYRYASLNAWTLFITVLNLPLLGLMFVADYVARVTLYPDHPQASIGQAIRAFSDYTKARAQAERLRAEAGNPPFPGGAGGSPLRDETALESQAR